MAQYKSEEVVVGKTPAQLSENFSDFTRLQERLNALPEEQRAKAGDVSFTTDSICINTPQVGKIELVATERSPERLMLEAKNSPVPMKLIVDYKAEGAESSRVSGIIDVEIPMMLKPLIGPSLQKAADQFGKLFSSLA